MVRNADGFGLGFDTTSMHSDLTAAALERPQTIEPISRSALGQLGIESIPIGEPELYGDALVVPIDLVGHSDTARSLIDDVKDLPAAEDGKITYNRYPLRFGRILDTQRLDPLTPNQVEFAVTNGYLYAGEPDQEGIRWRVDDDGSLWFRLAPLEFIRHEDKLADRRIRMNILHHGRAGIAPFTDDVPVQSDQDSLPRFFVGGIKLSPGPYDVQIQTEVYEDDQGNTSYQIPSASFIDGGRIMGVSDTLRKFDSHRQVELVTQGEVIAGDVWVKVNVFHPDGANRERSFSVNWSNLSPEQRSQMHYEGVSVIDVIGATEPTVLHNLMRHLSDEFPAYVISHQGVTPVRRQPSRRFQTLSISDAVHSHGMSRTTPETYSDLQPTVEALGPAGDRSRLVVADSLDPTTIDELAAHGEVRAVLAKNYGPISMTKEDHMMLLRASRRDVKLLWEDPLGNARVFEIGGHWVMPHVRETYRSPEISLAFYTSHADVVGEALRQPVGEFLDNIALLADPSSIILHHGNGSGGMAMVNEEGMRRGMVSSGTGIALENQGQHHAGKFTAQAVIDFLSVDRLYRQQGMDTHNTISIFNAGGLGTNEELAITLCSHKLLQCLPTPVIIVDESRVFKGVKDTVEDIATRKNIVIEGEQIDLGSHTLGPSWVPQTMHYLDSYSDAVRVIDEFYSDPMKYWTDRGITEEMLAIALANQEQDVGRYGLVIPRPLRQALSGII